MWTSPAMGAMTFRGRTFDDTIQACTRAGITSIGLSIGQVLACIERGLTPNDVAARLNDAGIGIAELEFVRLCGTTYDSTLNELLEQLIPCLTPQRVHVGAFGGTPDLIESEFSALCARHPRTIVALEFMPYSHVPDLTAAHRIVARAGHPNARIVLDAAHFFRSGGNTDELRNDDVAASIACLQLCDLVERGPGFSTSHEARHLRLLPGAGELPLTDLLEALHGTGRTIPVSVELTSDAHETLPLTWVLDAAFTRAMRLLRACATDVEPTRGADRHV